VGTEGNIVLKRTELVDNFLIGTTNNFQGNMDVYLINPAYSSVFPWLSKIAQNFESYRFKSIEFQLVGQQPSSTGGYVAAVMDFDVLDAFPATQAVMFQYQGVQDDKAWTTFTYCPTPAQMNRLGRTRYMNTAPGAGNGKTNYARTNFPAYPAGRDPDLCDAGMLIVTGDNLATVTGPLAAGGVVAQVWVTYEVELITPV
jgi:hypothetical protein